MTDEPIPACVATRLTSQGRGAVAVIAVEGNGAVEQVAAHFVSALGKPLASFPPNRIVFGRWEQTDGRGEEIVVCRTSETSLELNCHGGVAAARAIMEALVAGGTIEQSPDAWANRHCRDSIQAEAWLALADARTERTAAILLDQFRGALRQAIETVVAQLDDGMLVQVRERLATLLERGAVGRRLTKPWRVAFAGPPNVGKSSLMNCLLGYERSIVFDQPGTTRDLLSAPTAFQEWSMELTDTAGLRESEDAIEIEGVVRATSLLQEVDLTVLVFDSTCDHGKQQEQLLDQHHDALFVMNKCDLRRQEPEDAKFLATSAITGVGISELMQQIVTRLVRCELAPGDAVPFTDRQVQGIDSAWRAVDNGQIPIAIEELKSLLQSNAAVG